MTGIIQVVKQGVAVKEFSTEDFSLNILFGVVCLQDTKTRKIATIISPNAYDYIEVNDDEYHA